MKIEDIFDVHFDVISSLINLQLKFVLQSADGGGEKS